ncbi:hypothetical protein [Caulobacter segnis]
MNVWEWECFTDLFKGPGPEIVDAGPLEAPVRSFTIFRDENRDLVLETLSHGKAKRKNALPPGTVTRLVDNVRVRSEYGLTAIIHGVSVRKITEKENSETILECRQISHCQKLDMTIREEVEPSLVIDWVENLDDASQIWIGDLVRTERSNPSARTIGLSDEAVTLRGSSSQQSDSSRCALELKIDNIVLFVCTTKIPGRKNPGYILYKGVPSDEIRKRIRNVVGFCLGNALVYLGSTSLSAESEIVSTCAVAGNPFGDRIFDVGSPPPAPLHQRYQNEVNQGVLSHVADAIYKHYDDLDFGPLSWAYWHAVCAPVHMAAGHFGAAIEALQGTYKRANPNKALGKILADKGKAQLVVGALSKTLEDLNLDVEAREALARKIESINNASGALVSQRIFETLGIQLGKGEKAAWGRRNDAAHGNPIAEDDIIELIRDTKLLRILLNRMILKIANASTNYTDSYTIGHTIRPISQPVA